MRKHQLTVGQQVWTYSPNDWAADGEIELITVESFNFTKAVFVITYNGQTFNRTRDLEHLFPTKIKARRDQLKKGIEHSKRIIKAYNDDPRNSLFSSEAIKVFRGRITTFRNLLKTLRADPTYSEGISRGTLEQF